ncbi:MAG: sulfate transporter/antisigma-factor antagonist [Desulfobulbaceae bacterium]|jgi:anti-anti-sigma regulatory factor|nr:MAG: sulfate transporter/antisigma-factor antagonist [Desulfobulbaceae bacterium]
MQIQMEEGTARVILMGDLSVADAAPLRDLLLEALLAADVVKLDLEAVTSMDLATLQLLGSSHRTATTSGKQLAFTNCRNPALAQARKSAGFIKQRHGCKCNSTKACLWVGGME